MPFFLAAIAIAGAVAKTAGSISAANSRQEARDAMAKITRLSNAQKKREFLNKFRIAQANSLSIGAGVLGGLDSSRSQGQLAAATSQVGQGVFEFDTKAQFAKTANRKLASAANAEKLGNIAGAIGSAASSLNAVI